MTDCPPFASHQSTKHDDRYDKDWPWYIGQISFSLAPRFAVMLAIERARVIACWQDSKLARDLN
jgi:hypothetical protein